MIGMRRPAIPAKSSRSRRYSPLVVWFAVGMFLLVIVLPSALNLPQSNPNTIAEYAPVPPDDSSSSDKGNVSSLGIASSRGLGSGVGEGESETSGGGQGRGKKVSSKRCVGKPLRQTEDPMSPPCVAFFDGDNGGATYQGVKGDEIRIIVYSDRLGDPQEQSGVYYDLGKPAEGAEPYQAYELRLLQRYFNDRFQTYDRFVHFWLYYAPSLPTITQ